MLDLWVGKIPWRKEWLPTPVFLPGESHGQRNMLGYSSWGRKESEMTEQLLLSLWTAACRLGSSVHGILQARILEWVAIPFSMGSSQPGDQTQASHIVGRFFTI